MKGWEHYREAERLLAHVQQTPPSVAGAAIVVAVAQVHATLAQAAATIEAASASIYGDLTPAWQEVVR